MIQIWQVPSECGPSNLVVLGSVYSRPELIINRQTAEKSGLNPSIIESMSGRFRIFRSSVDSRKSSEQEKC
jgi:hypothetical protein